MTTPIQTKAIPINGVELHYLEQGQGDAVIFLHGGITDLRTWGLQMAPFSQHYHTLAYSLRYHYPNAWAGDGSDYTPLVHTQDLAALIQKLGLAPAHLVGSSYGADIALLLAHQQPELVRALVLGEPGVVALLRQASPETFPATVSAPDTWEAAGRAVRSGDGEAGMRMFIDGVLGKGTFAQFSDMTRQRAMDNVQLLTLPEAGLFSPLTCEQAGTIQAPALLLTGEWSPKPYALAADALERCLSAVQRASIPRAAHPLLHGMNPQAYNETVLAFLAAH